MAKFKYDASRRDYAKRYGFKRKVERVRLVHDDDKPEAPKRRSRTSATWGGYAKRSRASACKRKAAKVGIILRADDKPASIHFSALLNAMLDAKGSGKAQRQMTDYCIKTRKHHLPKEDHGEPARDFSARRPPKAGGLPHASA